MSDCNTLSSIPHTISQVQNSLCIGVLSRPISRSTSISCDPSICSVCAVSLIRMAVDHVVRSKTVRSVFAKVIEVYTINRHNSGASRLCPEALQLLHLNSPRFSSLIRLEVSYVRVCVCPGFTDRNVCKCYSLRSFLFCGG